MGNAITDRLARGHNIVPAGRLNRYAIPLLALPVVGVLLLFRLDWYLAAGLLVLGQLMLIIELVRLRTKHQKAAAELTDTNDRLQMAMEAAKVVGWDWDVASGRDQFFGDLQTMFGISSSRFEGRVEDFLSRVHPEDRQRVGRAVAEARHNRTPYAADCRVVRPDGTERWIASQGKFFYEGDRAVRMLGMAVDITERKEVSNALARSEEKFSKAFQQSPLALTISSAKDGRYIDVNETFVQLTGWTREDLIGRTPSDVGLWSDPEARVALGRRVLSENTVRNLEFVARKKTGETWTCLVSAELIEVYGESCVLAVEADITELKRAEATLRESEERFRLVANTAPVMIWMSGVDMRCNYFNSPWLEFTGRSYERELASGVVEGIHPDDLQRSGSAYTEAFNQRRSFSREYRLMRHDGEYRWMFDSGVPRFDSDGSFCGYIGSVIDVTDRKLAEEALSMVSRKLLGTQEEERAWIARELHDDIGQRLVGLMLNLESLTTDSRTSVAQFREGIGKIIPQASSLGRDIQMLSRRLHSSKLELLGLAATVRAYCEELSDQHKVEINLQVEDIPSNLAYEISLCVFRVLQESLQNAIKHSRARKFHVVLGGGAEELTLAVRDAGVGFDPVAALGGRGLGLTSMKERLKLVDGELSIESFPLTGTTIRVRVPLFKTRSAGSVK